MTIWIELADHAQPRSPAPLDVLITLDTDIYAETSWGEDRDNRVLARLNAPSFNQFLQQLVERSRATVVDVDEGDYRGQVDARGFVLT